MPTIKNLVRLKWSDWLLLLRAFGRVVEATITVRCLPYFMLKRTLQRKPVCSGTESQDISAKRAIWAIEAVGARMPGATCLVKALAGRSLLAKCGYATELRIGVSKDLTEKFVSHAWLELRGSAILGGETSPLEYELINFPPGS